jgi:hypothetical protein
LLCSAERDLNHSSERERERETKKEKKKKKKKKNKEGEEITGNGFGPVDLEGKGGSASFGRRASTPL